MWRAFFYAFGITLVILGSQCLVFEQFYIADGTPMPGFVAKFLDSGSPTSANSNPNIQQVASGPANQFGTGQVFRNSQPPIQVGSQGSAFGPSRFSQPFSNASSGPQNYYGGSPQNQRLNPKFSLAGFGNPAASQQNQNQPNRTVSNSQQTNIFGKPINIKALTTKDWMPWCLIAAGTLVVLYTKGTQAAYSRE